MELPVARVAVELPLAHLDHPFDYTVPPRCDAEAVPGVRVRVRFAGRRLSGFVLERLAASGHPGSLAPLERVVSPEPVLTPEIARLARAVADRGAGTLADVLRLAVPPRHARAEAEPAGCPLPPPPVPDPTAWQRYDAGPQFLAALSAARPARAVWNALPGPGWAAELAVAAATVAATGRGVLLVVPDSRDLARLDVALTDVLGGRGRHVCLVADAGPAERYRRFLAVRRGVVRVVAGTRAAVFAPVRELGLVAVWDDGDDMHVEPRAPYPHARDVAVQRAHLEGAAALLGGFAPSVEAHTLVESGWAHLVVPARTALRAARPRIVVAGDEPVAADPAARAARLPSAAWSVARDALAAGNPVLVQVPRRGYQPALVCASCRSSARCVHCAGRLARANRSAPPACRLCNRAADDWRCPHCGEHRLRAAVVGARRTVEELGRAFPHVIVRSSTADTMLAAVSAEPVLVVATPGAEPTADGGYGATLLLDGWLELTRPDLRAAEQALRRWMAAAALTRSGADGGVVVIMAGGAHPAVQALLRWQPAPFAAREAADRAALGFPPATRLAAIDGPLEAVHALVAASPVPATVEELGPVPLADSGESRLLLRVPRHDGAALAAALQSGMVARGLARTVPVRVILDPRDVA